MRSMIAMTGLMLLLAVVLTGCPWDKPQETPTFTSAIAGSPYYRGEEVNDMAPGEVTEDDGDGSGEETPRELVEPDVIRRQDNLLYVLNQYRGLTIVDLDTETLLSQTPTHGNPRDLYISGSRAYVLVSYARDIQVAESAIQVAYGSKVYVLNVEDPANVVVEGSFGFEGDLVDSRLVGNVIYAVCSEYSWYDCCQDGVVFTESVQKSYGSTHAVSLSIADPGDIHIVDTESFPGYGNLIQATNEAIFCAISDWDNGNTQINYVDISDPDGIIYVRGTANVPGQLADRFKMDAWNGALRVVSNTWWPNRETHVSTFDITNPDAMNRLGEVVLENASGETTYATRFDGPLAYIVTYFTTDPLFVVDLSDPTVPAVLGELKIPGWSTHIEPRGDRLIALGVDDADGGRKVMVSLFDVSDPASPQRLDYETFGDNWSWSSAYGDVKAFTVLEDKILVPFSGWNAENGTGYDRLQILSYTRDTLETEGSVDLRGSVVRSFDRNETLYAVTQEQLAVINADDPDNPAVVNSLTLAENVTEVVPLENGWAVEVVARNEKGDTLLRAVNHDDNMPGGAFELPLQSVVETFFWNNALVVVATDYTEQPEYRAFYRVYLVDFSDVNAPALVREWTPDLQPWWGGWWRGPGIYDAIPMKDDKDARWGYPWYTVDSTAALLAGDYLALRGARDGYSVSFGEGAPAEGLALIDLAGEDDIVYAGLAYETVQAVNAADGLLYITSRKTLPADSGPGYCSYYLQKLNPYTLSMSDSVNVPGVFLGLAPDSGNVLLTDQQYTEDWNTITKIRCISMEGNLVEELGVADLPVGYWQIMADGDSVYAAGSEYAYPYPYYDMPYAEGSGGAAVDALEKDAAPGFTLGRYAVSPSGSVDAAGSVTVTADSATLLGVRDRKAWVVVSGSAIGKYDFSQEPPVLASVTEAMSYPTGIRFGNGAAYIPLGYSGLVILED